MKDLDRMIQDALRRTDGEALPPEQPNVAEEVLATFRGRNRWLHGLAALFTFGLFALAVVAALRFWSAEAVREQLLWGGLTVSAGFMIGLLKMWFWLEMHTNRVLREVKRLELLLLTAADRRQ